LSENGSNELNQEALRLHALHRGKYIIWVETHEQDWTVKKSVSTEAKRIGLSQVKLFRTIPAYLVVLQL